MTLACIICNQPLKAAGNRILHCTYCGKAEPSDFTCPKQHYVCETCRAATPASLITQTCVASTTRDPFALADLLMRHPAIGSAGPEHHLIVPAVLLAACRNAGLDGITEASLRLALKRAGRLPLGACASWGACGAALGVGTAVSVITKATYAKPRERKQAITASALALAASKDLPGGRCCKAAVYTALTAGVQYFRENLGVNLPNRGPSMCMFRQTNPDCFGATCPFFEPTQHQRKTKEAQA